MSQSNKKDLRVFCEKLFFASLFSSKSQVFPMGFLCVLKMYHIRLFTVEKMGLERLADDGGFIPNLSHYCKKTCLSYTSETLVACVGIRLCSHTLARVCRPRPTYAGREPLWSFYFQKQIFAHLKCHIFHFNTLQVN